MLRPRRSVLYLPASSARALAKARQLRADVLVFDLEDAVAPERKHQARQQLLAALAEGGYGRRELVVRVNARGTPWYEADVEAVASSAADGLCLPKVEHAEDLVDVAWRLGQLASDRRFALWSMAETPGSPEGKSKGHPFPAKRMALDRIADYSLIRTHSSAAGV